MEPIHDALRYGTVEEAASGTELEERRIQGMLRSRTALTPTTASVGTNGS